MSYIPKNYTVENVTSGHPDKVCDQISDAILVECLRQDSQSRVAVETFGCHGLLMIGGEVTTRANVDYESIARNLYADIGYEDVLDIQVRVVEQSPDIARGVDTGGAGDQGIMYGYATNETAELMPMGCVLARAIVRKLDELRQSKSVAWLKPDGKAQITIEDGKPKIVLVSCQHSADVSQNDIRTFIANEVVAPILNARGFDIKDVELLVNPTGSFVLGGFAADTGLTGRKIMVDTYGGIIRHGGGAFSGKDFTKVDRSAALTARRVAKRIVSDGKANECLISVAYAIGRVEPVMLTAFDENGNSLMRLVEPAEFLPRAMLHRLLASASALTQDPLYSDVLK